MTPAEPSRPGRKWSSSRMGAEGPFWAGVTVLLFLAGLILLAGSSLKASRMLASGDSVSSSEVLLPTVGCLAGTVLIIALLTAYARHPRTRSDAATTSFTVMKVLMFLAGVVLFAGGAFRMIETEEFAGQIVLALLSVFYIATPLGLHFAEK